MTATAQAVSFALIDPNATLVKTVDQDFFTNPGNILDYELILTNTGNITLTQLTVSDPLTGFNEQVDELKVGQTLTLQTSYTVTQEDLDRGFVKNIAMLKAIYLGTFEITANGERSIDYLPLEIEANDDDFGDFFISFGGTIGNILTNDLLNGMEPDPTDVDIIFTDFDGLLGVTVDENGVLSLIPGLNPIGTYTLTYVLSSTTFPDNQDEAIVIINLINDQVDLAVEKTSFEAIIYEGDEFEYEVVLSNLGGTDAREVTLIDDLPQNVTYLSSEIVSNPSGAEATLAITGARLTWTIPFFATDASLTVRIRVKAGDPGLITNIAEVDSPADDINQLNDVDDDVNEILPFRITNVITPGLADGDNDTFEILGLNKFVSNELVIFNRNGDHVLETEDYQNDWNASGQVPGTYFYILSAVDRAGKRYEFKGWIQVIK